MAKMAEGDTREKENANEPHTPEKFVRLKLTDEVVEVTKWTSDTLTIIFKNQPITLRHDEIYHLPRADLQRLNQQKL